MSDLSKLAESYIKKQEVFYNRSLGALNKFLIRDFVKTLGGKVNEMVQVTAGDNSSGKVRVALITEDVGHLTGGRYYSWFIAMALVELGYEVTIYTNRLPVFGDHFKSYVQPNVEVIAKNAKELEDLNIVADIYIGSPISGNIAASRLGKKYQKPSFALIFDPFPMMAKYLGDKKYVGWTPLIKELWDSDTKIISLCNTTSEYIYEWLNKREDQVIPIYPCINSRENKTDKLKKDDYVVFISRLVRHKNFDHVVKACKNLGIKLKVISSVDGIQAEKLVADLGMRNQVDFHMKCSDREKFGIIARARVVVNASMFEGFGMWAIEAIALGVPVVCYKYPTIEEIKEFSKADNIYFADWNEPESFEKVLDKAYKEEKYGEVSHIFDFESMIKRVNQVFGVEPKIGVITIAINEAQYIGASLKSVIKYPSVKRVAVVEGAVNLFAHACNEQGLSVDDTKDEVWKVLKGKNGEKITYDRYGWALDKSELRNRALSLLGKGITHVLVVDADEVYKPEDLDNLVKAMRDNPSTGVFLFPFYHFWKQRDLVAVGGQWDSKLFRCFKYANKDLKWKMHQLPVVDSQGKYINVTNGSMELENVHVYHYGYLKETKRVLEKLEFYKKRDGDKLDVKDTFSNWKPGQPTQPTHGQGDAVKFKGTHPEEIENL